MKSPNGRRITLPPRRVALGLAMVIVGAGLVFPAISGIPPAAFAADAPAQKIAGADAKHPFTSTGLLAVKGRDAGDLEIEQQTQARLLVHGGLIARLFETSDAIHQTQWFKQFMINRDGKQVPDIAAAKADLLTHFEVTVIPKSRLIQVRMSTADRNDSQTIVRAIVDLHVELQRGQNNVDRIDRARGLEQLKLNYETQVRDINGRMLRIATDLGALGVGIGRGPDSKTFELQQLLSEQLRVLAEAGAAAAKLKTFDDQMQTSSAPQLEDAVRKNPTYLLYRGRVNEIEDHIADLEATVGAKDPQTIAAKARLEAMKKELDDSENEVKARTAEAVRAALQNAYSNAESSQKRFTANIDEVRGEISSLAKMQNEYDHLEKDMTEIRAKLDKVKDEQDRLGYLNPAGNWPVSWAALPDLPD